ncbi:MarR family transcriptional regulator [Natrinema sp. H-ect4]|uniref:MarR family transcriptional regulator n=1 Tax=Natrinema sp. H-ect4 TaxID=3242699 RepID=UPI0035A919DE
MSDTRATDITKNSTRKSNFPRAVIHKRILEVAESRPEAPMEEIADEVTGATTSLVEQVLDEYGDPGRTTADEDSPVSTDTEPTAAIDHESTKDTGDSTPDKPAMSDQTSDADESTPDPDEVTTKQLETLHTIRDHPHATQAELANRLGVASATISQRVNGINEFDWSQRQAFIKQFFNQDGAALEEMETDENGEQTTGQKSGDGEGDGEPTDDTVIDADATHSVGTDDEARKFFETAVKSADTALSDGGNMTNETTADDDFAREDSDTEPAVDHSVTSDARADTAGPEGAGTTNATAITDATEATERQSRLQEQPAQELTEHIAELSARIETLEQQLTAGRSVDPELAHKVIHACFQSEKISDDEEVRVLEGILTADSGGMRTLADSNEP